MAIKIKHRIKITTLTPKIRRAIFFGIAVLALFVRLPQLGDRPMHTDEAINSFITGQMLTGEPFRYDPQDRHGPALFLIAEPLVKLAGAENFSDLNEPVLRISTVLTGAATVFLFGAGVEMFGLFACLIAALLFALGPLPVYYSRYFIHETLFVAATLGLIFCSWRLAKTGTIRAAVFSGCWAALMLACKETAIIHFFALGLAWLPAIFLRPKKITAPLVRLVAVAGIVFLFAVVLLFTWFGQNLNGLAGLFHAAARVAVRAGGEGHEKSIWYYAVLLAGGWSGVAVLALAISGWGLAVRDFWRTRQFSPAVLISIYGVGVAGIYSLIPYKTPWLALNFWLPISLLSGMTVARFGGKWKSIPARYFFTVVAIFLALALGHDVRLRVFQMPADEKNPYAYAHTTEDILGLPVKIQEICRQRGIENPRIAVVAKDAWPLPWYLRKFSTVGYWQPGQETGPADFFITPTDLAGKLAESLKDYRPEFFGARPNVLLILWIPPAPASQP